MVRLLVTVLAGFALLFPAVAAHAQGLQPIAVLVVSDRNDPVQKVAEEQLKEIVKQLRTKYSLSKESLPVMSYHFDDASQREACLRLGVKKEDLIFIGIVQQHNMIPLKVMQRTSRVQDPKSEAFKLFAKVALMLGLDPTALLDPNVGPAKVPTGPIKVGEGKVEFSSMQTTDSEGNPTSDFKSTDVGVFFNVFIKNDSPDIQHSHSISVVLMDPDGRPYGRPMGGKFDLKPGVPWLGRDIVRASDPKGNNGFKISDTPIGSHPGDWKVAVELDGKVVKEDKITVKANIEGGSAQVGILQAFVSDEKGNPKTEFKPTDLGAFVFVIMQNLDVDHDHDHLINIRCIDPKGAELGRLLGGKFTVKKGEDLTKREFPADVDSEGGNGFLIRDGALKDRPGDYKFLILLDGKVVKELPFKMVP